MKKNTASLSVQEKLYRTMRSAGVINLVFGIILIIVGVGAGVMSIINGGRLLRSKSKIIF